MCQVNFPVKQPVSGAILLSAIDSCKLLVCGVFCPHPLAHCTNLVMCAARNRNLEPIIASAPAYFLHIFIIHIHAGKRLSLKKKFCTLSHRNRNTPTLTVRTVVKYHVDLSLFCKFGEPI